MILSNLETDGSLALSFEGETKAVVMLTDASAVPFSAYYTMPSGYVEWLSIGVAGNVFSVTAENNLFSEASRSVVVQFCCMPTDGGTLQTTNVTVTQASDSVSVTFDPTSLSLAYQDGSSDTVAVTGIPSGTTPAISTPDWLAASLGAGDELTVTADLNLSESARSGSVTVLVETRPFYLPVTQAANTAALTFDPATVSLAYTAGATDDVTVTGIPAGSAVVIAAPAWLTATLLSGVLTVTATANDASARSASVELTVEGKTYAVTVTQAASPYQYGPLVLDESFYTPTEAGGSIVVTATSMPTNAAELSVTAKKAGTCTECGDAENVVTFERLSPASLKIIVAAQDMFDGVERAFTLVFSAGNETVDFLVTQDAPPTVHRFYGSGDKFLRSATSEIVPAYLAASTAQDLLAALKSTGWVRLPSLFSPILVAKNADIVPRKMQSLEAFKACYDHKTVDGTSYHQVSIGAAVYRMDFEPAAYGLVLRGIRVALRSDAYCSRGIRVALETTNETDDPSADWLTIREGTGGFFKASCAMRKLNDADGLYYGVAENVVFDGIDVTVGASTRLYLYLTMEDYRGVINGWIYGSGMVTPVFDLYSDELAGGLGDYDTIAVSSLEKDAYPLVTDGAVLSPTADPTMRTDSREIARQDVVFGQSPSKNDPTPVAAASAIAYLTAMIAEHGMTAADLVATPLREWQAGQFGLTCSVCRQIVGSSAPFTQRLIQAVSPVAIVCALPPGYVPTFLRLTHRAGLPAIGIAGADIRLAVYWIPSLTLTLKDLSGLYSVPGFSTGDASVEYGEIKAARVGKATLPSSIAAGDQIAIEIAATSSRWGTLLIVPWVARVTALSLVAGEPVGLVGVDVGENEISGTGWVPDIQMEA